MRACHVVCADAPRLRVVGARAAAMAAMALGTGAMTDASVAQDASAATQSLPRVEIVGTSPLPGSDQSLNEVPGNVRVYGARALSSSPGPGINAFVNDRATSFTSDDPQGNRFATDVSLRGFTASPLLGSAQGLSVFLDGVRVNEAFGDVVNWDLLPRNALASLSVIPGSNPLFGLNTLGGALALTTKNGASDPGPEGEASVGAWGRRSLELAHGGGDLEHDWFFAGTVFREDGWRQYSESTIRQLFGKGRMRIADSTRITLSAAADDNVMNGTQSLPRSWLETPREAYTWPDYTQNRLLFLQAALTHELSTAQLVSANVFQRTLRENGLNSNVDDGCNSSMCATNALNDRITIVETRRGASAQWVGRTGDHDFRQRALAGATLEFGSLRFVGDEQPAQFDASRGTVNTGPFATQTAARGTHHYATVFVADTLSFAERLHVTLSGTQAQARISVRDASGDLPALDGDHSFGRFNKAIGATFTPRASHTVFAQWSEGLRAPTAIELTCAEPTAPCRLPNVFLADPPLRPVRAQTSELGWRYRGAWSGSLALFRTELADDIQFVSTSGGTTNAGYFRNVGRTRRAGIEASVERTFGQWSLAANWQRLQAIYRDAFSSFSPNNSSAEANGDILITPGSRLPGLPRDTFKIRSEFRSGERGAGALHAAASVVASSRRFARGDENNADASGALPGFALLNMDVGVNVATGWELTATLSNALNRVYQTGGVLGSNVFNGPGRAFTGNGQPESFRTPGAPRALWIGVRFVLD